MKHQHNIVFHLTAETNFVSSSEDVNMNTFNIEISPDVHKDLWRVIDEEKVVVVVAGRAFIEEIELEVKDLQLNDKFQFLTTKCRNYLF